jgi:predicted secreted protein
MKMAKRVVAIFSLFLASMSLARAGDAANVEVLGFSENGNIFAFEEYGIQDGSGFPYANRYYIDTNTDEFLPGTPILVQFDNERAELETARSQASALGESIIQDSVLRAHRGNTVGMNSLTELNADPFRMVVNPRPVFPQIDATVEFRLEEIPLPAPEGCESLGPAAGFRLLRIDARDHAPTRLLHEDTRIPKSRNCPNGYRIGGVQSYFGSGRPAFAVLIAVRQHGFEGPDFRWIAVTGRL